MAKTSHPKRGSLAYSPRKRAKSPIPRIRSWVKEDKVRMQGFAGYKAGLTHVVIIDDTPNSLTHGEEIVVPATVLETPPLKVCGIRVYGKTAYGLKTLGEIWSQEISEDLRRVFTIPKKFEHSLDKLDGLLDKAEQIRLIVHTQPRLASVPKKKPEVMEYFVSGSLDKAIAYAKEKLGKEIRINEVFQEGELIDVFGVTKGKGFQSPVRKWGVKHLPRKTRKGRRTAGTLGPWHPAAMMWSVPQSGQMGYHQRTEFNKRILKIGSGEDINPRGGFLSYGIIRGDYVLIQGSVPGPRKRLIRLRPAIRPPERVSKGKPQINYISLESKQGV
ncbi:MAG: 50S ribosomal protein L3 [Candidatus Hydrothermarchaeota archaeon]|nr:MAG: 50S ribosomal protein L3 [Candidatus Hydrothermarchaeota archaeon]